MVKPFKDQESANYVKKELKNLSIKVQTTVQPVFASCKIGQDLVRKTKPQIINQHRIVCHFQCDLCDVGYVGYTPGHLHRCVDGHKEKASSVYKHYHEQHGEVPKDLLRRFSVLKKCRSKFDCVEVSLNAFHQRPKTHSEHAKRLNSRKLASNTVH